MVKRHKKKVRKQRGSQHHGWGKQKGHKKAGIRGGVGKAGSTTRHKIKYMDQIGKHGFTRPPRVVKEVTPINVSHLQAMIHTLLEDGDAKKEGNSYTVNLDELGYNKLLAQGNISIPIEIKVETASKRAIQKVEEAGGKVIIDEEE